MNVVLICILAVAIIETFSLALSYSHIPATKNGKSHHLIDLLVGEFNNRRQADADAFRGRSTAKKGGHEFVSVIIERSKANQSKNQLIARYFYGTDIANTFRCRIYEFPGLENDSVESDGSVLMKIYRPSASTETILKENAYDLTRFSPSKDSDCEYLENCDLLWTFGWRGGGSYSGRLINCGVEVPSQRDPNCILVVYDDLRISQKKLSINDRIYVKDTGELIYGNTMNVPYTLDRLR